MAAKNNNKSLILYTSLIFFVAVIMIVVSFLAQTHLDQAQVSRKEAENVNLSNKAAQVSEENMQLVELNKTLRESNDELSEKLNQITSERDNLSQQIAQYNTLAKAYEKLLDGNKAAASALLNEIYTENLSPSQKECYDRLLKQIN